MKKANVYFSLIYFTLSLSAQYSEFQIHENGLIYNENTINQLHKIVDSLNVQFIRCDLNKDYKAKLQGKANSVLIVNKRKSREAMVDLKRGISWNQFISKYNPQIDTAILVVKYEYENYNNDEIIKYQSIQFGEHFDYQITYNKEGEIDHSNSKWIFAKNWDKSLRAFYFSENLSTSSLPYKYARLVQYSNCMIDTTSTVIYEDASREFLWDKEAGAKVTGFFNYANSLNKQGKYLDGLADTSMLYWENYRTWDSLKFEEIDKHLPDEKFLQLLSEAVTEALDKQYSFAEFEKYVELYLSKEKALELKRNREVIGSCSMDFSPREHIKEIAILSAETAKWDVFLKSHLDVMNDNVNRRSDGSWAWEHRNTYIKELEVLDINVLNLLMGISLRIENSSKNHYFGSINRVGRALSEYSKKEEFENLALEIIGEEELDSFNRLLTYYLLLNYRHNLNDETDVKRADEKLSIARGKLPDFIGKRLKNP